MKSETADFSTIVETVYNLSLEYKEELKSLLERNIADARRVEISENYKKALKQEKSGKLKFSSSVSELKKML